MERWSRVKKNPTFPKDQSLIHSTHIVAGLSVTPVPGGSDALFWPLWELGMQVYPDD